MGLTKNSVGKNAADSDIFIKKQSDDDKIIALAGNPNVGKSTIFNELTGMNQHTGNWPGKTVTNAQGRFSTRTGSYVMVDIPGTYSLMAHSAEEEVARNFICFGNPDAVIVVCDATCLERNMNLVLQTLEITQNVIVCVNLMDEAKRKHVKVNLHKIAQRLSVPVIGTSAKDRESLGKLTRILDNLISERCVTNPYSVRYPKIIEQAIEIIEPVVSEKANNKLNARWLSLKLLDADNSLINEIVQYLGEDFLNDKKIQQAIEKADLLLETNNISKEKLKDMIVTEIFTEAENICKDSVTYEKGRYSKFDRKIDKILTSKLTGFPIMIILLAIILWITISAANYPSQLISDFLFSIQNKLSDVFWYFNAPAWVEGIIVQGVYRVLAWVVSVMLPPMAIFFPLFTLLEDVGYLPRIAYNLDRPFKKCKACGKQALTMCMGFGCNAAGIVGCRIIDSPRERLLAILTNTFVPCNGRFPTLISIITMFFVGVNGGLFSSFASAILLTFTIVLGILATFLVTRILSNTLLKGVPSSFTLELPPYRKPQIGNVIVRSIFDRTIFVLGRAVTIAAPAGMIIWIMANVTVNGITILKYCTNFLNPFAQLMGLDGVILMAFILGFPANEIVIPIIIMAYMAQGSITEFDSLSEMRALFVQNGWNWVTAINMMLFSIMHWPCSTTVLTIKKETGSWKWSALAIAIPTMFGIISCIVFTAVARLFIL